MKLIKINTDFLVELKENGFYLEAINEKWMRVHFNLGGKLGSFRIKIDDAYDLYITKAWRDKKFLKSFDNADDLLFNIEYIDRKRFSLVVYPSYFKKDSDYLSWRKLAFKGKYDPKGFLKNL